MSAVLQAGVAALAAVALAYGAEVRLAVLTAAPGANLVVPVTITAQSGGVSGLQFDLVYDGSALTLGATVGDAARNAGKGLYLLDLLPGERRFLVAGVNQNAIAGGVLVNLFINISPNATAGLYPLRLTKVVGAGADGHAVPMAEQDGAISVQGLPSATARLRPEGVLNGASLLPGPVAPGEVLTLMGAGIGPDSPQQPTGSAAGTVLGGASVLFDGKPAPLLYAGPNQINLIAPYGIQSSTQVQIARGGQTIAQIQLPVAEAAPGIFAFNGTGVGSGAILNQDLLLNSPVDPAPKGTIILVFATGAGQTNPPGVDGQITGAVLPQPILPVTVQIGGVDAKVLYAGAAPGLVAGMLQVNCVVPESAPSGYAVPIVLSVGNFSSPAGITVAIQ